MLFSKNGQNMCPLLTPKKVEYKHRYQEEFEDTKGAIIIRISKKNRQHNGQKKKYKRTNNDVYNIHKKKKTF
jgi:hypothetical protein